MKLIKFLKTLFMKREKKSTELDYPEDDMYKGDFEICAKYRHINSEGCCVGVSLNWVDAWVKCKECNEYFENVKVQ